MFRGPLKYGWKICSQIPRPKIRYLRRYWFLSGSDVCNRRGCRGCYAFFAWEDRRCCYPRRPRRHFFRARCVRRRLIIGGIVILGEETFDDNGCIPGIEIVDNVFLLALGHM